MVGVNGTGKTTTIGKLAWRLKELGKTPLMVAGDTFRAAAVEQLAEWASRVGCEIVKQAGDGDPAAVVYDGVAAARSRGADVVLVDTAGRLHTQVNLMRELEKVRRVIEKQLPGAPHETLLVLDATTGPERPAPGAGVHSRPWTSAASCSPSSTAPPRAASWSPSTRRSASRSSSSAWGSSSRTCGPFEPDDLRPRDLRLADGRGGSRRRAGTSLSDACR